MQKIFGTDGVRGIYGEEITPKLAYDVGRAVALYLKDKECINILVAKDTRLSGDILMTAFSSGAMSMGVSVTYIGKVTTPCVAYLTKTCNFGLGVMITASHNSKIYNGIKIFKSNGEKLGEKEEQKLTNIYKHLDNFQLMPSTKVGKLIIRRNLPVKYYNFLKSIIRDKTFDFSVAFDCANGVAYSILKKLFDNNFKKVHLINISQNGNKVNHECGATDTASLSRYVVDNNIDFGFAYDGDADRVVMVDGTGQLLDGDDILYNLAIYLKQNKKLKKNIVVGTTMTNIGLELALKDQGIGLIREDVGDKYIVDRLTKGNLSLGGEKAGHIIPLYYTNTGDGILTSLIMLSVISQNQLKKVKTYPQVFINISVDRKTKEKFLKSSRIEAKIKTLSLSNKDSRIVVRPSGTENKIRIMVEDFDKEKAENLALEIQKYIEQEC